MDVKINDVIVTGQGTSAAYYQITAVEPLYYQFPVNTQLVSPGQTAEVPVSGLTPESGKMYLIDAIGVSGGISIQPEFPEGKPLATPKNVPIFLDELMASKYMPFKIQIIINTSEYPGLKISAPASWNGSASVWFYGVKLTVSTVTSSQADMQKAKGFKVIYSEAVSIPIETGQRPFLMILDPVSQRFIPKQEFSGIPQQAFLASVGSTSTAVLPVPSGSAFVLTDISITPHYTYTAQTTSSSGIAASPGTAVGLSGPLDLLNLTINNTTTTAVTVVFTDGSGGGIIYQTSVAASTIVSVNFSTPISVVNQIYAYASTASVVNVSVTERFPSEHILQLVSISDGTTQVASLTTKAEETFTKSFKTPIVFRTAVQVAVSFGAADVTVTGLIVV